jgi:hypothetical protein
MATTCESAAFTTEQFADKIFDVVRGAAQVQAREQPLTTPCAARTP